MGIPKINYKNTAEKIAQFLKGEFKKRSKDTAIVAVSGGVDSSLTAKLCEMAGLKVKRIYLPYGESRQKPENYSIEINIASMVDEQIDKIGKYAPLDKIDKGNIMARTRMIVQYALARRFDGLVAGTENLSEYYLGYFTLYGDQACDINPIGSLWKTQIMELARFLGLSVRTPSAELWEGQTDEKELGFSYEQADSILYLYCLKKFSPSKIIKDFGLNADLAHRVVERVKSTEYKRKEVPKYEKI